MFEITEEELKHVEQMMLDMTAKANKAKAKV